MCLSIKPGIGKVLWCDWLHLGAGNANNLFCQRPNGPARLFPFFFFFFFHPLIFHPLFAIGGPGPGPRCHLVLHWAFIPALISNIFTQERDGPQWRSGCSFAAWNRCTLSVGPGLVAGRVGGAADCAIFWVVGRGRKKKAKRAKHMCCESAGS